MRCFTAQVSATSWVLATLSLGVSHASCASTPPLAPLGVNDVSILFPLPQGGPAVGLLPTPYFAGERGELLPRSVYDRLPLLLAFGGPTTVYGALRVVAVRIDPCFPGIDASGPAACRAQLRLVFQPLTSGFDSDPTWSTDDAAVHAFYALERSDVVTIATELSRLRAASGVPSTSERLGRHPVMVRDGLDGPYARGVLSLLRRYAGQRNLVRVTFMTLEQFRVRWAFGGFDVGPSGELSPITIAASGGATRQVFSNMDMLGQSFERAAAMPASASPDDPSLFYRSQDALAASAMVQRDSYRRTLRIENPTRHSPETVDCVSCHTATSTRVWAERNLGLSAERETSDYFADGAAFATVNEGQTETVALRAFGYVGRVATVSRRTVNESVVVARELDRSVRGP